MRRLLSLFLVLSLAIFSICPVRAFPDDVGAVVPSGKNAQFTTVRRITDFANASNRAAVCDGTTDNAAAFAAASSWLATAPNRVVFIPAGAPCATSQSVTVGNGRQQSTTLSANASGAATTLTVSSIAGIQNGDAVYLVLNSGFYTGTVNGAPSGSTVTITPALGGSGTVANSGNLLFTGHVSTSHGGGFQGYGSCAPDISPGTNSGPGTFTGYTQVSTIKYVGSAAPTTTVGTTVSSGQALVVASNAGISLGGAIGITLDNGRVWWTSVTATPATTTIAIANEVPSTATAGNTVTIANNPVLRVQGTIDAPVVGGLCLDGGNAAAIGLDVVHAVGGQFRGPRGVTAINYTAIGEYLHPQEATLGTQTGMTDNEFELYSWLPANQHTIGLWFRGAATHAAAFSRNRFIGGTATMGGADITAAAMREEYADNNTFIKPYTTYNPVSPGFSAGAGLYRQASPNRSISGENIFLGAAIAGGVTDGTATGGSLKNDFFFQYGTSDGEPVPTGKEVGILTNGKFFGASFDDGAAPALTSCGTNPAISGSNVAGLVTMGTGSPTGCVITFANAYSGVPSCTVTWQIPLASQSYVVAADKITLTQTGTSSNKVNYQCSAPAGG